MPETESDEVRFVQTPRNSFRLHGTTVFAAGVVGALMSLLTYTVTVTLAYSAVVRDVAVIRATLDERTLSTTREVQTLREELASNRQELTALRLTISDLRTDLARERSRRE